MARKSSPTILQEELYSPPGESGRDELDDARLLDLDVEEESRFLRGQKRVSARRPTLPKRAVHWLKWTVLALFLLSVAIVAGGSLYQYGERDWRFRIDSSDNIEIDGTRNVPHSQVMEVLGGDIGRNIFFIPLAERKAQLEKIAWIESASVMRFVPNRLVVDIHERTPIAFARLGPRISLIDTNGTLMELPGAGKQKYSFPVIVGMNPGEPPSTRFARMKIYNELIRQLDSDGAHYAQDLSEVDISDPDDVKVLANDPAGAVLVHLGSSDFLPRYKIYVNHLQSWRQQFDKLDSVDLRYDHQIIVNPDTQGAAKPPQLTPAAAKAAMAAGVKPAALIHVLPVTRTPPPPISKPAAKGQASATSQATTSATSATLKPASKPPARKAAHRAAARRNARRRAAKSLPAAKTPTLQAGTPPANTPHHPSAADLHQTEKAGTAASASAKHSGPERKKPSPAVAKNSDQQDRP